MLVLAVGPVSGGPAGGELPVAPSPHLTWATAKWGDPGTDAKAKDPAGKNKPSQDAGSMATITTAIGARAVWKKKDPAGRAITGQGVTVALLDSGVNDTVAGLDDPGKVIHGPDLSLEANSADLRNQDTFGHGTHLASIIAGRDAVPVSNKGVPIAPDTKVQLGVAPDARLLAVKLATTDGSTDVSEVIAGLDWVVQHRNDNGMAVRVVNLSYGTLSAQSYQQDPLAAAVENAWKHGIVVVVSGGNEGSGLGRLSDPAIDPYVLAVGASDPLTEVKGWSNPAVASFSSRGSAVRHVDLVAPGTSIAGLRDPGSYIDAHHPEGLVSGDTTGRLFRGSGTSQAAAVTSGAVALLLQADPQLSPDQVKAALTRTADPAGGTVLERGSGQIDVDAALKEADKILLQAGRKTGDDTVQSFPEASGLGSLEGARGGDNLSDAETGALLSGEVDVQGSPWNPAAWRALSTTATAWSGGRWNGAQWSGSTWSGPNWLSSGWDGARWTGSAWRDVSWTGARWTGARWTGARWTGQGWTDQDWQ